MADLDTQDYARLQLALASLGESFINRYPNSGGYQSVMNAKDVAQSTIASEEAKKQQKKAEKEQKKKGIGGLLGSAVPLALAPVTGGASLAFTGLGGQAGQALMGGTPDPGAIANSIDPSMFAKKEGTQGQQDFVLQPINPPQTMPVNPFPPPIDPWEYIVPLSLKYGQGTPYAFGGP